MNGIADLKKDRQIPEFKNVTLETLATEQTTGFSKAINQKLRCDQLFNLRLLFQIL